MIHRPIVKAATAIKSWYLTKQLMKATLSSKQGHVGLRSRAENLFIERSLSFMAAHKTAQAAFKLELQDANSELSESAKIVMEESKKQCKMAEEVLKDFDEKTKELAISHKFCKILLTMCINYVEKLVHVGLLKEAEVEPFVEEIEEHLDHVLSCDCDVHPGERDENFFEEYARDFTKSTRVLKADEDNGPEELTVKSEDPIIGKAMEQGWKLEIIRDSEA